MVVKKALSKQERLDKLVKKLQTTDRGGRGKGFWSPKVGRNVIRILPEVGEMEFFFQEVGKHRFPGTDAKELYCPKFTSTGELECPVCELLSDLWAGDSSSKRLAKQLKLKRSYWMNVINRDGEDAGPVIFTPGVKILDAIASMVGDPDYGDITDVDEGLDIIIDRKGTGLATEYQVKAKRASSPLSEDQDLAEKWLAAVNDLSWIEVSEDPEEDQELSKGHAVYLIPYDRIVREYSLEDLDVESMLESIENPEDEDEEGYSTAKRPQKKVSKPISKPVSKTSKKVVEEEEIEAEEEVEEEPEKEVSRRMARRSRR